jgi:hypothetical protein
MKRGEGVEKVKFNDWLLLTTGKKFDEYFDEYPSGVANFLNHLLTLQMSFLIYCKENGLPMEKD